MLYFYYDFNIKTCKTKKRPADLIAAGRLYL